MRVLVHCPLLIDSNWQLNCSHNRIKLNHNKNRSKSNTNAKWKEMKSKEIEKKRKEKGSIQRSKKINRQCLLHNNNDNNNNSPIAILCSFWLIWLNLAQLQFELLFFLLFVNRINVIRCIRSIWITNWCESICGQKLFSSCRQQLRFCVLLLFFRVVFLLLF